MTGGYLGNALAFLVDVTLGLYVFAVLLRFLFQSVRADFYNPISQSIVRITNPPLSRLRRHVPSVGRVDTASVLLLVGLQALTIWLKFALLGHPPALAGVLVGTVAALLTKTVYVMIGAILILVVASWVTPGGYSPLLSLADDLARPLLRPVRRMLPDMGGLDLSPLVALVVLQLAMMLVVWPLRDMGLMLS